MAKQRALEALRVSRYRVDEKDQQNTVSPEVQQKITGEYREDQGWDLAGRAEDLDVSAYKISPFERPDLGHWLNFRKDDFDIVIWARLDRAIRNMADMAALVKWAKDNKKTLVFVRGPGGNPLILDMKIDAIAEFIVMVYAFAAQAEAQADSERVKEANIFLRAMGRYRGGWTPMGYRPATNSKGRGFMLEQDPDYEPIVQRMITDACKFVGPTAIATWLDNENIPTSRDIQRIRMGRKPLGTKWHYPAVLNILRSRNLCGITEYDGQIVYGDDGMPLRFAKGIIDDAEFAKLQKALDKCANPRERKQQDSPWLVGVSVCDICGQPLHTKRQKNRKESNKVYMYMICAGVREGTCRGRQIRMRALEPAIDEKIAEQEWAKMPYMRPRTKQGHDNAPEIATLTLVLKDVAGDLEVAKALGEPTRDLESRKKIVTGKLRALRDMPLKQPDTIQFEATDQTVAMHWASLSGEGKSAMLHAHKAKIRAAVTDDGVVVNIDRGTLGVSADWLSKRRNTRT